MVGADLLELGPGPGITTEVLRPRVARVTAVELDAALAARLARRLAASGVRVVRGDGRVRGDSRLRFRARHQGSQTPR
jgi:16S rRNA A1518/A1519 N6-dimethyltransferase RsmA/KsgA/DIM1 with predicted DNA glycosylase/AP lyase activity